MKSYFQEYSAPHGPNSSLHMAPSALNGLRDKQREAMQQLAAAAAAGITGGVVKMDDPIWQQLQQVPEQSTACYDPQPMAHADDGVVDSEQDMMRAVPNTAADPQVQHTSPAALASPAVAEHAVPTDSPVFPVAAAAVHNSKLLHSSRKPCNVTWDEVQTAMLGLKLPEVYEGVKALRNQSEWAGIAYTNL